MGLSVIDNHIPVPQDLHGLVLWAVWDYPPRCPHVISFLMHGKTDMNKNGRLGDITGRTNEADLNEVENRVIGLLVSLGHFTPEQ